MVVLPVPTSPVSTITPSLRRGLEQLPDGLVVRLAQVEEMRVGREREWRLREAVVLLVGLVAAGAAWTRASPTAGI